MEGMRRPWVFSGLGGLGTTWAISPMVWVTGLTLVVKSLTTPTSPATTPCSSSILVPVLKVIWALHHL